MPKATTKKAAVKKPVSATVKKAAKKAVSAKKTDAAPKPVAAKRAAKKAVAEVASVATPAPKAVARKPVAKKAAARKEPAKTTVIAKYDAGFGNHLTIRGNCSGLTWDSGVVMENIGTDEWSWTSTVVTSELEFKVLLNDEVWSTGANGIVFPGATVVFQPGF